MSNDISKLEAQNRCLSSTSVSLAKINLTKFSRCFVTVGYIRRPTGDCSGDKPAADTGNASSFQRQSRTSATSPVTTLRRADSHARYHFARLRTRLSWREWMDS